MERMSRNFVVPAGCQLRHVTLDVGWEAWDRLLAELRAAGVEVRGAEDVHLHEGAVSNFAFATAQFDDRGTDVRITSPALELDHAGQPVLPDVLTRDEWAAV